MSYERIGIKSKLIRIDLSICYRLWCRSSGTQNHSVREHLGYILANSCLVLLKIVNTARNLKLGEIWVNQGQKYDLGASDHNIKLVALPK